MRTEDLIRALVADNAALRVTITQRLGIFALAGGLAAGCLFALLLAPRPDLGAIIAIPQVAFKFLVTFTLVAAAGGTAPGH